MIVTAGATNKSIYYYIVGDASHASPGEPITGLLFSDIETGGSASYARQGAARVDLTLITLASASAAHSDGGFILVDDTNMPGVYRCDYPDAAFATGVDQVVCSLVVAAANNAVAAPILIDITDVDLRDSVRAGLTALPNAAADAAGGLPISDAGALDLDTKLANTNEITVARMAALTDWINGGRLDLILDIIAADTTTDIPALIATAQADLDTITGADGATLASTQGAITYGAITYSVTGATDNITFAGSGSGDVFAFTRSGSGDLFNTAYATDFQANVNAACDLALTDYDAATGTELAALNNLSAADILTTQLTESYAADGAAPTLTQSLMLIQQMLGDFSISGTTLTVKQVDGSTTASTFTLDDGTTPTSITRAT